MTLKTEVMAAENSAVHYRNKLHFKIYLNRKQLFEIVIIFHNITDLINAVLVSIKCIFLSKNIIKILQISNF